MQTDQITAALDAANIRHTPEAVAMLAELQDAEPDWEQYREAREAHWGSGGNAAQALIAAWPHMPETKAVQAEIADLRAKLAEAQSHLPTSGFVDVPDTMTRVKCDKCGAEYPYVKGAMVHKCGQCSGGFCFRVLS